MSYTYQAGFIGAGNMGGALALAAAKTAGGEQVAVSCSTADSTAAAAERLGCAAETPARILRGSRFVFLGMKPQMLDYVMAPLAADVAGSDAIFVSMLAGVRIERLQKLLGAEKKIIRIMPNTPCAVGEGMILLCRGAGVTDGEVAEFRALMAHSGLLDEIPETQIDAASAVAGCGPAFAYLFVEALADGGVACGLPRAKAQRYAAQMLLGSAAMVLQSGKHPGLLKDEVCSPGGSTIAGVHALERGAFRNACFDAVEAAYRKTTQLGYTCPKRAQPFWGNGDSLRTARFARLRRAKHTLSAQSVFCDVHAAAKNDEILFAASEPRTL